MPTNKPKRGGNVFEQCGAIKADGTACRGPKKKGYERCHKHNGSTIVTTLDDEPRLPTKTAQFKEFLAMLPDMSLQTMRESTDALADTINRLRAGELPTKQAQVLIMGYREHIKALSIVEKLDPKQIARREFTAETARELARSTTLAEARDILSHRSSKPLKDLIERSPKTVTVDIGDATESLQRKILKELEDNDEDTENEDDA